MSKKISKKRIKRIVKAIRLAAAANKLRHSEKLWDGLVDSIGHIIEDELSTDLVAYWGGWVIIPIPNTSSQLCLLAHGTDCEKIILAVTADDIFTKAVTKLKKQFQAAKTTFELINIRYAFIKKHAVTWKSINTDSPQAVEYFLVHLNTVLNELA